MRKKDIPVNYISSEQDGIQNNIDQYLEKPIGSGPRADFKPEYFDNAISQKGYRAVWEQAMLCPCHDGISGQPEYHCPMCKGRGYYYFSAEETTVLVTSINGRKEQTPVGIRDAGTAYATPLSICDMGYRDRLTFMDFRAKFTETVIKSKDKEGLRYRCVKAIAAMYEGVVYKEGLDFMVEDGEYQDYVVWSNNTIPDGERYSIIYQIHPSYVCMGPIHEIRGTYTMYQGMGASKFVALPKQFLIKKEDYLENGVPNIPLEEQSSDIIY